MLRSLHAHADTTRQSTISGGAVRRTRQGAFFSTYWVAEPISGPRLAAPMPP